MQVRGTAERPRLAVFRSLNHIYAQIIDDAAGKTLVAVDSRAPGVPRSARRAGAMSPPPSSWASCIAQRAKAQGIGHVVFDRGGYQYHGRVKALAEAARTGGLGF